MSPFSILRRAALPCLILLPACSSSTGTTGSDTSFPAEALQVMACDPNMLSIEVRTAPVQPPTTGLDGVEVVLTDPKTGDPIDGVQIALVPWMPLMGHGADLTPQLKAMGKGHYVFTNVNLYMPGEWQLRFQFSGKVTCSAAPTFNVP
jgi:hypothetical protein